MRIEVKFALKYANLKMNIDSKFDCCGVTAISGHSGAGKSTFLRFIAGLTTAEGVLKMGDEVWQDNNIFVPPHKRSIGYVFQDSSLFPHLSVNENLMYAVKRRKNDVNAPQWAEIVDLLGIGSILDRNTGNLSGGEKQRVAIARAIFTNPRLLLFDEPLASLDSKRKLEIIEYIKDLKSLNLPVLYVTHSQDEIEALADSVILMENGIIADLQRLQ